MSLAHFFASRKLALLASDALEPGERERVAGHAAACARCDAELRRLRATLERVAADPVRSAELPIDLAMLVRRTQARIDRRAALAPMAAPSRRGAPIWAPLAVAAALAIAIVAVRRVPPVAPPTRVETAQQVTMPGESLRRIERTVEREQAARYLDEAETLLVTVAGVPQHCEKGGTTVDLAAERKRSRELLSRRTLLVDMDSEEIRSARPVLEDVEHVLRQVAALDPCARPEDLIAIHEELRERRLLMKIDLMTKELLG